MWLSAGKQSTDDAQVEGHITQLATRVGGTVVKVSVADNQHVEAGTVVARIDPRDYQVAVDRARAELADAEAAAAAAGTGVPIAEVSTRSDVSQATGGVEEAQAGIGVADSQVESAKAQLVAAQARLREREATATKNAKDVERLKPLVAKEEIPQQQFDATVATSDASRAAADAAKSEIAAAETAIATAQQRAVQARAAAARAEATLQTTQTAPEQIQATRARASAAEARVKQMKAALAQAEIESGTHDDQGAIGRHRQPEDRRSRPGRAARPAADGARLARRRLGRRQLQGDAAPEHARRAARHDRSGCARRA